ncbi:MAG: hypothetical protein H0X43_02360 [Nitrosospira sp.]|nr:hypothetical protein [Nitrosospira sp.]
MAFAPEDFGVYSGELLAGNLGEAPSSRSTRTLIQLQLLTIFAMSEVVPFRSMLREIWPRKVMSEPATMDVIGFLALLRYQ